MDLAGFEPAIFGLEVRRHFWVSFSNNPSLATSPK